jgi:23S rRNA A2030 N6-methylase RlmJ
VWFERGDSMSLRKQEQVYLPVGMSKHREAKVKASNLYSELKESLPPELQHKLIDLVDVRLAMEVESSRLAYDCGFKDGIQTLIKALV